MAPLSEVLELYHSGKKELPSEQIFTAVEAAVELLGNASSQMSSSLRRTRVLQEYTETSWCRRSSEKKVY